jgi:hypothetical protein
MPKVPGSISRTEMREALAALGVDTDNLHTIHIDAHSARLSYYAADAAGQKYLTDGAPTEISYTVPLRARSEA